MIKKRLYSFGLVLLLAVSAKLGAYFLIESVLYSNATKITSYEIKEKLVTEIDVTTERLSSAVQRQAKSASLTNSVSRENALQLTDTVYKFRDQFFLSEAFVTNAEGIVVAEASEIANRGDYIFDTTLYGKEVSEGKDTDAVVVHAESLAVHLLEGSPLQSSTNTVIGGLFATQAFDTAYLETVATNAGVSGVAVYTTEGVSASSFSTEQHNLIVDTYFGVVKSLTAATFDVDMISLSGQVYLVYHIPFSELGYRDTNAGLLYFVAQDLSIFVFTALLIGIFLVVLKQMWGVL